MKIIRTVSTVILTGVIMLSMTACFPSTQPEISPSPETPAVERPTAPPIEGLVEPPSGTTTEQTEIKW